MRSGDQVIARDRVIGKAVSSCHRVHSSRSASTPPASSTSRAASLCHPERERVEQGEARSSRRIAGKPGLENAASGSSHETTSTGRHHKSFSRTVTVFFQTLIAMLREIFDESAYDRFLQHAETTRSVESYQAFMREKEISAARRPRCC